MKKKILLSIDEELYEKLLKSIPMLKLNSVQKVINKILEDYFKNHHDRQN